MAADTATKAAAKHTSSGCPRLPPITPARVYPGPASASAEVETLRPVLELVSAIAVLRAKPSPAHAGGGCTGMGWRSYTLMARISIQTVAAQRICDTQALRVPLKLARERGGGG